MDNSKHKKIYDLYDEDGNLYGRRMIEINKLNRKRKIYYNNWKLCKKGIFKKGKLNGEGEVYYENGKEYYPNGILKYEGQFKKGLKKSTGKSYNTESVFW
ncbi:hypothetical protein LN736_17865 [Clostridium sp. WLY-B-L2]|uniref:MORN repeat variant n=1 Tax=Clostridium aromativorans TaxID=2836848 RepID=A0ABS8NA50_9CLOT|nr:hypothetical protein [Clostridium aromativorans]MCC9296706.1 hypothetical protein [Clostridium aromativorans]